MTDERADLMLEVLKGIQHDVASIKREQVCRAFAFMRWKIMCAVW